MDLNVIVHLQLFSKSKLRSGTKTFLDPKFFCIFNQIQEIRAYCHFKALHWSFRSLSLGRDRAT